MFIAVIPILGFAQPRLRAGIELDALPYLTGGYFGAGWIGSSQWHLRGLYADVNMPHIIIPDQFSDLHISSVALIVDYFHQGDENGIWIGAGPVIWSGEISESGNSISSKFKTYLFNGSLGYRFLMGDHFYLSPWAGMSLKVIGDQAITVGSSVYHPKLLNPEMSVKVGYRF